MPVDEEAAGVDIHLAARSGDIQVVRSLVQRLGADVDARDILGDSALLKSARYGHTEVVEAMLQAGANRNAQDNNGWTPLHVSIANNRKEVFFVLLSQRQGSRLLNIEAATSNGDTPLHMAAYHGHEWAVDALLLMGADCLATNAKGQQPLHVARHNTVRSLLQPRMTPDEQQSAADAADNEVAAEDGVGISRGYGSGGETVASSLNQIRGNTSNGSMLRWGDRRYFGEKAGRLSAGGMPLAEEIRPPLDQSSNATHSEQSLKSSGTGGEIEYEQSDRSYEGSLVGSLAPTDTEGKGVGYFSAERERGPSFEEGSSEGLSEDESQLCVEDDD